MAIPMLSFPLQSPSSSATNQDPSLLDSEQYCDLIQGYTKQNVRNSLYPGNDFLYLIHFLLERKTLPGHRSPKNNITLYLYTGAEMEHKNLSDASELEEAIHNVERGDEKWSGTLFLAGFPSPAWVASIGGLLRLDPSFFQSHMAFPSKYKRHPTFSHATLPSAMENTIRLRIVSIGERPQNTKSDQPIDNLRAEAKSGMEQYLEDLGTRKYREAGYSIVRDYHLHDIQYFSIEQDISVCQVQRLNGFLNVVWLDSGNDLSEGPQGPWRETVARYASREPFLPTIRYRPNIALDWHTMALPEECHLRGRFPQSIALLHHAYRQPKQKELMISSPFYSLYELFAFCAYSSCQFLNLIGSVILADTGYKPASKEQLSHSNLLYHQDILEQHLRFLRGTLASIRSHHLNDLEDDTKNSAITAMKSSLLADFGELLQRAQQLSARCASGMDAIMNQSMISESQRAIQQARKIEQLTWLASFYIPLSFVTSFFGMNLGTVGDGGKLPIWLWFVVAIPTLALSLITIPLLRRVTSG